MRLPNYWANRILALLLLGYGGFLGLQAVLPAEEGSQSTQPSGGGITAYFTNPGGAGSYTRRGGPDARLAAAIDRAADRVELAAYDLTLWSVRDALIRAHQRGVQVRVVLESSHLDRPEVLDLLAAGIEVRGDGRPPLMHDKFLVIDDQQVWTGSMNFTVSGTYSNNNNLVQIISAELSARYSAEFEEMFERDEFGQLSVGERSYGPIELDGAQIEVWFSPDQPVGARITELIQAAEHSIVVMAFNLTADPIAEALVEAAARGVQVRGLFETAQANNQGSDVERLAQAGIEVIYDSNPRNMHHKVMVIDEQVVITGSYNFSRSAEERNDENLLVISSAELAEQYLLEFSRLRTQGLR